MAVIEYIKDLNIVGIIVRIFCAMLIGGITGLERGKQGRAAGMRTHILVCLGSTLTSMLGFYSINVMGSTGDPLRIAAQVVSGIGFLGVGTILIKGRFQITGLTTAAGLWCTATVGIALGAGFYEGAILTFVGSILTITIIHRLESTLNKKYTRFGIYIEAVSDTSIREIINYAKEHYDVSDIQITTPRSGTPANIGIEMNIYNKHRQFTPGDIELEFESLPNVVFTLESI